MFTHSVPDFSFIMAVPNSKKRILIITDSRGAWLPREIRNYTRERDLGKSFDFRVIYRKGAGLAKIWEIAEHALFTRKIDLLFLLGGICDITGPSRDNPGRRVFWPCGNLPDRMDYVINIMEGIASNFKLLQLPCKLCFIPEPGADLIRYNRLCHPVDWNYLIIQEENFMVSLHSFTRRLNKSLQMPTPWTLDASHTHRNGRLIQVYSRFRDGLHPALPQLKKWAEIIVNFVLDLPEFNGDRFEQN